MQSPDVVDHPERRRFELETPSGLAVLDYARSGTRLKLLHTEVPEADRGRGLGSRLVEGALMKVREQELKIVPICPFVRAWLAQHPEMGFMVAEHP